MVYVAGFGLVSEAAMPSAEANAKAESLLLDWLLPHQLEQYRQDRSFVARGSRTGTLYQISALYESRSFNVTNLATKQRICFGPPGTDLPYADFILSQKLAIETDEDEVLAVANVETGTVFEGVVAVTRCPCDLCRATRGDQGGAVRWRAYSDDFFTLTP
jgi:hypothetical protein